MKKGIVIVEDNPVQLKLVCKMLETFGNYDIYEARDANQAMACLAKHRIEVALCDIGLPGISGLDLARTILDTHENTVVIMLTANEDPVISQQAVDMGACGYLVKPVKPSQLRVSIARAIKIQEYQNLIKTQQLELEQKISFLEETKKQLQKSEEKFRSIFENIQEGFFRAGLDGRLTMANPMAVRMMGYDSFGEIDGIEMVKFYQNLADLEKMLEKIFQDGHVSAYGIEIKKKDGSLSNILVNSHLRYDFEGCILGIEGTLVDITDRKRLEAELAQSQKLESIGQLAAGIAHEINTPIQYVGDNTTFLKNTFEDLMTLIQGYTRLLAAVKQGAVTDELIEKIETMVEDTDFEFLNEEVPAAIGQSLEGVARVSKIVKSMKEFSHPGGESHVQADINRALKNTVIVAKNEWKYVADLTMDLDKSLPPVFCNPREINQVFLNLLINASQAVEEILSEDADGKGKGKIRIETEDRDETIEIRISDTGNGIPKEARDRIFDPFFTTKEIGKGTGQGLAISHSVVVDKHRGNIRFETRTGKGTIFFINLPKQIEKRKNK